MGKLLSCKAVLVASHRVFGGGGVAENIHPLHHAFQGGQRVEITRGGRAGAPALNAALQKGRGRG